MSSPLLTRMLTEMEALAPEERDVLRAKLDVRVSQSMLLVEPVKVHSFAPHQAALDLLRRYDALRGDSSVIGGN